MDAFRVKNEVALRVACVRETLVAQREARDLTQVEVAKLTFPLLTLDTLKKLEVGLKHLKVEHLVLLANIYQTTVADIVVGHVRYGAIVKPSGKPTGSAPARPRETRAG